MSSPRNCGIVRREAVANLEAALKEVYRAGRYAENDRGAGDRQALMGIAKLLGLDDRNREDWSAVVDAVRVLADRGRELVNRNAELNEAANRLSAAKESLWNQNNVGKRLGEHGREIDLLKRRVKFLEDQVDKAYSRAKEDLIAKLQEDDEGNDDW